MITRPLWLGRFIDAIDFEFVSPQDRMFVVDMGDSKVKVVDLDIMEITSSQTLELKVSLLV